MIEEVIPLVVFKVRRRSDVLRVFMAPLLALFAGVGCFLDGTGLAPPVAEEIYRCTATLVSAAGEVESVDSMDMDSPFFTSLLTHSGCRDFSNASDVENHWRGWIQSVVTTDPDLMARGPWDCATIACAPVGPAPTPPTCPALIADPPLGECASAPRCLSLTPPGDPAEPTFESRVDFGMEDVGATSSALTVEVRNSCPTPVRVQIDGGVAGRDADDFGLAFNNCLPVTAMEEGRELTAAGTPDDACSLGFEFEPTAHGSRGARSVFTQDMTERFAIALRGEGLGGMLDAPASFCVGAVTGPVAECPGLSGVAVDLVIPHLDGPAVEITGLDTGFNFGAFVTPTIPITVAPGGSATVRVFWCLPSGASDFDDTGTLTLTTNGRNSPDGMFSIDLEHFAGGCP